MTDQDSPPADRSAGGASASDASGPPPAASNADAYLIVARVLRAHGVNGELSCEIITEFPERFQKTKRVFLSPPVNLGSMEPLSGTAPQPMTVTQARLAPHRG
jgi:ribosomal 30S subunit maturation factor RimM